MSSSDKNKVARGKKVNQRQKEDLVTMIEENITLYHGRFSQEVSEEERRKLWENIATKLNAGGDGAVKDWDDWRRCWGDLKSRTKAKCQANNLERQKTGGGEPTYKPLTQIEDRIAGIIGKTAIDGIAGACEGGFGPPAVAKQEKILPKKRKLEPPVQVFFVEDNDTVGSEDYTEYYVNDDGNLETVTASIAVPETQTTASEFKEKSASLTRKSSSAVSVAEPSKKMKTAESKGTSVSKKQATKATRSLEPPPKNTTTILVDVLNEFSTIEKTKEGQKAEAEKSKLELKKEKLRLLERLVNAQENQVRTLRTLSSSLHTHLGIVPETEEEHLLRF